MKQNFNIGVAKLYGIDSAIIVDIMVNFCKCARNCPEYRKDGKVFVPRKEIWDNVKSFMPKPRMQRAINFLIHSDILCHQMFDYDNYAFSYLAKDIFSKNPIRITINWQ